MTRLFGVCSVVVFLNSFLGAAALAKCADFTGTWKALSIKGADEDGASDMSTTIQQTSCTAVSFDGVSVPIGKTIVGPTTRTSAEWVEDGTVLHVAQIVSENGSSMSQTSEYRLLSNEILVVDRFNSSGEYSHIVLQKR